MARLSEDGQWIVMMGFIVSITIFILAIIVGESALVGKTTSESVLEFSKTDIQDLRTEIMTLKERGIFYDNLPDKASILEDISTLSLQRRTTVVNITNWTNEIQRIHYIYIHFNNGITNYNEVYDEYY